MPGVTSAIHGAVGRTRGVRLAPAGTVAGLVAVALVGAVAGASGQTIGCRVGGAAADAASACGHVRAVTQGAGIGKSWPPRRGLRSDLGREGAADGLGVPRGMERRGAVSGADEGGPRPAGVGAVSFREKKRLGAESRASSTGQEEMGPEPRRDGGSRLRDFFGNNFYIRAKFGFTSSAETPPTFAVNTRFQRPFLFAGIGRRNQFAFGPEAHLIASSSDQDDEDSIVLAAPITYTRSRGSREQFVAPITAEGEEAADLVEPTVVNSVVLKLGPALEVDSGFDRRNFVSDGELSLGLTTRGGRRHAWDARPFVGFEAGRDVASGEGAGRTGSGVGLQSGGTIGRIRAGVDARLRVEADGDFLQEIAFELEFVHRQLYTVEPVAEWVVEERTLSSEDGHTAGEEGGTEERVLVRRLEVDEGRGSRRYLRAGIRLAFTENWGFGLSYVRGGLPPRFVGVAKVEAGFELRLGNP